MTKCLDVKFILNKWTASYNPEKVKNSVENSLASTLILLPSLMHKINLWSSKKEFRTSEKFFSLSY